MKTFRVLAMTGAAIVAGFLISTPTHADTGIQRPFAADSGDACRYGSTEGTLTWRFGVSGSPLPLTAVDVKGTVTDRPLTGDPGFACRDDGYFSTASFTAYSGTAVVAERGASANNAVVSFSFTLAPATGSAPAAQITRVVVRVCRDPLVTLPPSYCGKPVEYDAPPVALR